jgi:hypothetical protein
MTIHSNLPVYKASYDFLLDIFVFIKNFKREYKYTIGEDLKKEMSWMMADIYRANNCQSKYQLLESAIEHLEVVRLYIRLMKDLKQISLDKFISLNEKIESVSVQLYAWQKSSN